MGGAKRPAGAAAEGRARKQVKVTEAALTEKDGLLGVEEAKAYFEANGVKVHVPEGKDVDITPAAGFRLEGFAKRLVKYCEGKFEKPTPIQACCWPVMMQRSDICGIAKTGSGKTMAFAMPYLSMSRLGALETFQQPCHTPRFVAMAPTRELAMQISEVCKELSTALAGEGEDLFPVQCIYGGVPKRDQRKALETEGVDMLVATPGRLQDLVEEGTLDLSYVQYLVLDEADRMLDMGFIDVVKSLISKMPKAGERQTCMFSATWPTSVHHLATQFLEEPVHVGIGSVDEGLVANAAIRQEVEVLWDTREKPKRLLHHLKKHFSADKKVIIFGLYKKETAWLETFLKENGYSKTAALQGDMTQAARTQAIADFKACRKTPLIATDVASRGLDVQDVELVINYTFPLTIEDYVHRIGRTGRAGKSGLAVCFFQPSDKSHAGELQQVMKQAGQSPPEALMKFGSTIKKKEHKLYGNFGPRGGAPMKKATRIVFD